MEKLSGLVVIDGGEVKSTEADGVVMGDGIVFGSAKDPDQSKQRDFFTKDSFISNKETFETPLYYEHGAGLYDEEIGTAILSKEANGWKAMAQIDLSNPMGQKVYEAVKDRPHGFSTGALVHLVKRVPSEAGTNWLKRWVVGEISLTERPAERKARVEYVKSLNGEVSYEEAFVELAEVSPTIKAIAHMEAALNLVRTEASKSLVSDEFQTTLIEKIKEAVEPKSVDTEQISKLEVELKSKEEELAGLRDNLKAGEESLTKANEKIAQLEILAGAKEFIDKHKGK